MDEHVFAGAVLAPEFCRVVVETFPTQKLHPHCVEDVALDVELGEMVADVLLGRVAEQLQLGHVRP